MTQYSTVIPTLRYQNAPKAIDWLCKAFGFQRHTVIDNPDGTIAHAELSLGTGVLMLASSRTDRYKMEPPAAVGGVVTGSIYVALPEVDQHCARAKAAGAAIIQDPTDQDYGGRDYSCRDLEGNLWHFGTYAPTID
jgi:uncharacterized glyoxalase superfamily protein PhnB